MFISNLITKLGHNLHFFGWGGGVLTLEFGMGSAAGDLSYSTLVYTT